MPSSLLRSAITLTSALCLTAAGSMHAPAGEYPRRVVRHIAPGITHVRILRRYPPNHINVLRVAARGRPSIDAALAYGDSFGFRKTSRVAAIHGAIAAVNGTFSLETGRPYSVFARNGELKASPLLWSRAFSLSANESDLFVGHPRLDVWVDASSLQEVWSTNSFNEPPEPGGLAVHTPVGGRHYRPPTNACAARLGRTSSLAYDEATTGVQRSYVVRQVRCSMFRMARHNRLVLSARRWSQAAVNISSLEPGDALKMGWTIGWPRALDVVGGNPVLLSERRIVAPEWCASLFCHRNPRTGIGITPGGEVLLITVDGRQPHRSVGMTLAGFGRLFKRLGAANAINLDGGGSTTMVVKGEVVNRPSDPAGQRRVGSMVLVHRATPPSAVAEPSGKSLDRSRRGVPARALQLDPASTGGMIDAVASGALGPHTRVPKRLRHLLGSYRSVAR
jgi:hypothetical protein